MQCNGNQKRASDVRRQFPENLYIFLLHLSSVSCSAHGTAVTYTFTQMLIRRVVGESFKLVLNRLTEMRVLHDRVLGGLIGEIGIKVSNIKNRFLIWRQ